MNDVQERLDAGEIVILDGAMGTELQRRGVPMDEVAWDAAALATHPDLVREVHEDYIKAVTLAKEAREDVADGPVFIAGSISTMSARADNSYEPRAEKARENYREQAEVLAESGVDVIVLEMMRDLEQTSYAMEAAVATRLPVWVGFSCKTTDESTVVLQDGNHTLAQAIEQVPPLGASLVSIMHTLAEDTPAALREVTSHWQGPVGAYPHSGEFIMPNWQFINMISPEDFTRKAQGWTGMGVQLVGGCCGIGPEHIRLLKERLARPSSS